MIITIIIKTQFRDNDKIKEQTKARKNVKVPK